MTLINTDRPSNLFLQPQLRPEGSAGRTLELQPEQLVRALVVAQEGQETLLEIRQHQFLARSERALQVGQTLRLEVLQSEPRLEFRVLSDPLREHLRQRLPLLARPYDWSRLGNYLPRSGTARQTEFYRVFSGLFPDRQLNEAGIRQQLDDLLSLLKQASGGGATESSAVAPALRPGTAAGDDSPLSQAMETLLRQLDSRLVYRERGFESTLPTGWKEQLEQLSATLARQPEWLLRIPAAQQHALFRVYHRLLQAQLLSPVTAARGEKILQQLLPLLTAEAGGRPQLPLMPGTTAAEQPPPGTGQPSLPVRVAVELERLVTQLHQAAQQGRLLSPDLAGRLEGLLEKLHLLALLRDQAQSQAIPGLDVFISQLGQLAGQPAALSATGGQLGLLAQFFGLHLERELAQGRYQDALKTLKASLLKIRREQGREVEEPLRRVELFQLCKARLAEEQVQFLPLPLPELEEGYLLAERQSSETDKADEETTKLSLSLRLSALGSLRVDMVFTGQGLQLQLVSENRQTMDYLRDCADELRQAVQSVNVQNLSFATGAGLPGKQLQERLLPDLSNLLDMRA